MSDDFSFADLLPVLPVNERGTYLTVPLLDGRVADIVPRTFGGAQIAVSRDMEARAYDDMW